MNASAIRPLDRALLLIELTVAALLLAAAVVIGPYYLINLPNGGWAGSLMLLAGGLVLLILLFTIPGKFLLQILSKAFDGIGFPTVVIFGIIAQVLVALLTQPVPQSDGGIYLGLAEGIVHSNEYRDQAGHRALWPPGLPFVLSPFVALAGAGLVAIALCNLFLYLVGVASARLLGSALFGERVGIVAALLFTLWPSRLLTAAVASKENLTMAAMLAGTALCVAGLQRSERRWRYAAGSGIAFGIAGLSQPGLLLFVFATPLCYRYFAQGGIRHYIGFFALVIGFTVAVLLPWQARNCVLFEGDFCGVSTNGGSVFYRANNPLATGEWTAEGEVPITHLPELEQNRLGFQLGKQWIAAHPSDFAILVMKKLGLLLRDDRYGAYWGVLRGTGQRHEKSIASASPGRMLTYQTLHVLSWMYWAVVTGLIARSLVKMLRCRSKILMGRMLPLVYPLLYSAAVFSVFESDRRQHMFALALLLVLVAWVIVDEHKSQRALPDK